MNALSPQSAKMSVSKLKTAETSGRHGTGPATILIVEDEPEILEPLAHSLQREGYRVLAAEDGLAACRLIGTDEPDLVLLDIMLPDLDGWEVCRMLRQHPMQRVATTPVIMLTALDTQRDKLRGLELGADAYLPKPYSIREVLLYAGNLIQRRQQTLQLEQRLEQAVQRELERANFNYLLFHELRNQLLVLNGYTELLGRGEEAEQCLGAINRSSAYLNNLAEEILLIRQVEDGRLILPREELVLTDILQDMLDLYAGQARQRGATIQNLVASGHEPIRLNPPALKIILSTLLDNALKYGPEGQTVTISGGVTPEQLDLLIADRGPGIPLGETERIFEPFYRASTVKNDAPGSGLGLYGVRILSRAMGGDVTLDRSHGDGCRFRVRLQLRND